MSPRTVVLLRRAVASLAISATVFTAAACTFDPADVPLPGFPAAGAGYRLHAEFTSALNLPQRAPVKSQGQAIGSVAGVRLAGEIAVVDLDIDTGITVAAGTRAELRQDTLLGDLYLALDPPAKPAGALAPGATIPIADTTASNIEDLLNGLASMVNGGTAGILGRAARQVGAALPDDPQRIRDIAARQARIVHELDANRASFDRMLTDAEATARALTADRETITRTLTEWPARQDGINALVPTFARYFDSIPQFAVPVAQMATDARAREITAIIDMLAPLLRTTVTLDLTLPKLIGPLDALITTKLVPLAAGQGGIDARIAAPPVSPDVLSVLRATGMVTK
ncbi:MlaD family protein [Nocardia sp. CDC159]|uniref:MlaD family protein n=1 Tax=Nocardia pulmonis TaxID=2951408 RepID=A0A9X2E485_9NOCA|nr:MULTISPECIES: MlaD family protein [Nocardia]MCM6774012.1 MlaD family protein [Nocardia pulmonis]MCM6786899.1 MlaD family protein [Nocardia sp. CDC159]